MKKTPSIEAPKIVKIPRITVSLKLAGQDRVEEVDNILNFLRSLDIDSSAIKSRAILEVSYKGEVLRRIYNKLAFQKMLVNDITRQVWAKYFNNALGIFVDNYK